MVISDEEVLAIVGDIWASVVGVPVVPSTAAPAVDGEHRLTGFVHINGDWEGSVMVDVPATLAAKAAAAMFGAAEDALDPAEIEDALGELANMTGGGVKAMAPGLCQLSLPTVIEGVGYTLGIPGTELLCEVWVEAATGHVFAVRVLGRAGAHVSAGGSNAAESLDC